MSRHRDARRGDVPGVEVRAVDPGCWDDLVALFEARGGPSYCWCLAWREPHAIRRDLDRDGKRALMERRVHAGEPIGLLAYRDGEPVGWCSIAPRDSDLPLGGPEDDPGDSVWSVVCFFVPRRERGQGIARALLDGAIAYAAASGADIVESYPVDPDSPSYRHMGQRAMFEAAGFAELGMAGTRRHVMRRRIER